MTALNTFEQMNLATNFNFLSVYNKFVKQLPFRQQVKQCCTHGNDLIIAFPRISIIFFCGHFTFK